MPFSPLKTIGARLTFWFALASLLTLGCFFRLGRYLLEQHAIHDLDLLIVAQYEQLARKLGTAPGSLSPAEIHRRMRETAESSALAFRTEIDLHGAPVFKSGNLGNGDVPTTALPATPSTAVIARIFRTLRIGGVGAPVPLALRSYNVHLGELGELRVGEFRLGPYDVRIAASKEQVRNLMTAYREVFYGLLLLMVGASAVIGVVLSRLALRPLRAIEAAATRIGAATLGERIPVGPVNDEISRLARLLNAMFDRLEVAFDQTRRFAAEASHELKTPLSLIRIHAEKLVTDGRLDDAQEEALQTMLEEIGRLNRIIEELLFISRANAKAVELQQPATDPAPFVQAFAHDAEALAESRAMRFAAECHGAGLVEFDAKWIRQVLLNLVVNAFNVSPNGGLVRLRSTVNSRHWRVTVEDEGPGVPEGQRNRMFERFVRIKHAGLTDYSGTGLGLAICRSVVELHHGAIWAETSDNGRGLRVVFELPCSQRSGGPTAPTPGGSPDALAALPQT